MEQPSAKYEAAAKFQRAELEVLEGVAGSHQLDLVSRQRKLANAEIMSKNYDEAAAVLEAMDATASVEGLYLMVKLCASKQSDAIPYLTRLCEFP